MKAICLPRRNGPLSGRSVPRDSPSSWSRNSGWSCPKQKQSSRPAFRNSGNFFLQSIARIWIHPLNLPSPLLWSITWPPRENRNHLRPVFRILSSNIKTLKVWWIRRTEAPISVVFAVQPWKFSGISTGKNSWLPAFFQTSAKGWPYRFRLRGTTGSSILDHELDRLCFGRRIQVSGHSDFGFFFTMMALIPCFNDHLIFCFWLSSAGMFSSFSHFSPLLPLHLVLSLLEA